MSADVMKKLGDDQMNQVAGGRKSDLEVAYDVMNGNYGNGDERIRRLRAAGYDPAAVQAIVNRLASGWRPVDPYLDKDSAHKSSTYRDPYLG